MSAVVAVEQTALTKGIVAGELFAKWLAFLGNGIKPLTRRAYTQALQNFFGFLNGKNPTHVDRAGIIEYLQSLGDKRPSTQALYLQAVKLFYTFLNVECGLPNNPTARVKAPKGHSKEFKKDFLTKEKAALVLNGVNTNTLQGKRDKAILALMLTTGLRCCEVSTALVGDLTELHGARVLFVLGKARFEKGDYVKIPAQVEALITDYLAARGTPAKGEPLFVGDSNHNKGGALSTRTISGICKESMRRVGIDSERLTAHSLRHTAAVLNLQNGGSLEETRQMLRHTNILTTQLYSHAIERVKNQSEERVADVLFG